MLINTQHKILIYSKGADTLPGEHKELETLSLIKTAIMLQISQHINLP